MNLSLINSKNRAKRVIDKYMPNCEEIYVTKFATIDTDGIKHDEISPEMIAKNYPNLCDLNIIIRHGKHPCIFEHTY